MRSSILAGEIPEESNSPDISSPPELHVDHVIPKSKGGPDKVCNYVSSCALCNTKRGNSDLSEEQLKSVMAQRKKFTVEDFSFSANYVGDGKLAIYLIRCATADHDWHVVNSPAFIECHRGIPFSPIENDNLTEVSYSLTRDWKAVFGLDAEVVYERLRASVLWRDVQNRGVIRRTFPAWTLNAKHGVSSVLECESRDEAYRESYGDVSICGIGYIALAQTNLESRKREFTRTEIDILTLDFENLGLYFKKKYMPSIRKLFVENSWNVSAFSVYGNMLQNLTDRKRRQVWQELKALARDDIAQHKNSCVEKILENARGDQYEVS